MPIKLSKITRADIAATKVPQTDGNFSPVSHDDIMMITEKSIKIHGFDIKKDNGEEIIRFTASSKNEIVGSYCVLNAPVRHDMEMIFCWVNSYNKNMRFRCAVGCRIKGTNSVFIPKYTSVKKNFGSLRLDIEQLISETIENAPEVFHRITEEIFALSLIPLNRKMIAETLGQIYFDQDYLTSHQASTLNTWLKDQFNDTSINWDARFLYEMIGVVTYGTHPRVALETHSALHQFLLNHFEVFLSDETIGIADLAYKSYAIEEVEEPIATAIEETAKEEPVVQEVAVKDDVVEVKEEIVEDVFEISDDEFKTKTQSETESAESINTETLDTPNNVPVASPTTEEILPDDIVLEEDHEELENEDDEVEDILGDIADSNNLDDEFTW